MSRPKKVTGLFLNKQTKGYQLFLQLPVLPSPGISKKDLAKKLKITVEQCHGIIARLPGNIPVYEEDNIIGRLKW